MGNGGTCTCIMMVKLQNKPKTLYACASMLVDGTCICISFKNESVYDNLICKIVSS